MRTRSSITWPLALVLAAVTPARCSTSFTHYEDGSCQLIGDTDIYGIGVRIGYYLTFAAGLIALAFGNNKGIADSLKAVNVVFGAILIVLLRNTIQGSFAMLEWYISANVAFILPLSSLMLGFFGGGAGVASWGAFFALFGIYAGLQPWLYWKLLDQGRNMACPSIKMFLFTEFDFYNYRYVKFLQVMSIISCIFSPVYMLGGSYLIISSMRGAKTLAETSIGRKIREALEENQELARSVREALEDTRIARTVTAILILFSGANIIASVEKMLVINHIDLSSVDLASTGQLIPFLVGLFAFLSTSWSVLFHNKKDKGERRKHYV